jgi:hypothetical protein
MQFEIQFAIAGSAPNFDVYHVHTSCYVAWELERKRSASQPCGVRLRTPSSFPAA